MTRFTCDDARLHDYADGTLGPDERAAVDAHLPTCASCRAELARIAALARRVGAAPRDVPPARDLWPALRARIAAHEAASAPDATPDETNQGVARVGVRWSGWPLRAAAGIAVAVASSAATIALLGRGERGAARPAAPVAAAPALQPAPALPAATAGYESTARDLAVALEAQRPALAPETIATVEAALRVVDSAIAEGRAALARDPGNAMLAELLAVTYRQKVDVLRRAVALPTGI